jgi:S-adenosylmethionine:tRNA ribosyltransferase-isomerase
LRFNVRDNKLIEILKGIAQPNIPFYIRRRVSLKEYQNVYAKAPGSTQCPTAGLHFTNRFLNKLKEKKVDIAFITLHIGGSEIFQWLKTYLK